MYKGLLATVQSDQSHCYSLSESIITPLATCKTSVLELISVAE